MTQMTGPVDPGPCMRCRYPYAAHTIAGACPPKSHALAITLISIAAVAALILAIGAWRIFNNEMARYNPPASCQLLGGSWSIWNGWQCV